MREVTTKEKEKRSGEEIRNKQGQGMKSNLRCGQNGRAQQKAANNLKGTFISRNEDRRKLGTREGGLEQVDKERGWGPGKKIAGASCAAKPKPRRASVCPRKPLAGRNRRR